VHLTEVSDGLRSSLLESGVGTLTNLEPHHEWPGSLAIRHGVNRLGLMETQGCWNDGIPGVARRASSAVVLTATVTATAANSGELQRTLADERAASCVQGERWRTVANAGELKKTVLKTTKVQAFGGSNPSPSASALFRRRLSR